MNETIGTILAAAMNEPKCSILTGMMMGSIYIIRYLLFLFLMLIIYKFVNNLAINPLIDWLKNKIYSKKKSRITRIKRQ